MRAQVRAAGSPLREKGVAHKEEEEPLGFHTHTTKKKFIFSSLFLYTSHLGRAPLFFGLERARWFQVRFFSFFSLKGEPTDGFHYSAT